MKFFQKSYRFRSHNKHYLDEVKEKKGRSFIYSVWHKDLLSTYCSVKEKGFVVIASKSKDAEFIARASKLFGHIPVRGSSRRGNVDKGGRAAKELMIEKIKEGRPGAVTVDGPKGPALKVKPGIIDMARQSQAYILPVLACPEKYWEFKSWDKFRLAKPFSKVHILYGEAISVPANMTEEEFEEVRLMLEKRMIQVERDFL